MDQNIINMKKRQINLLKQNTHVSHMHSFYIIEKYGSIINLIQEYEKLYKSRKEGKLMLHDAICIPAQWKFQRDQDIAGLIDTPNEFVRKLWEEQREKMDCNVGYEALSEVVSAWIYRAYGRSNHVVDSLNMSKVREEILEYLQEHALVSLHVRDLLVQGWIHQNTTQHIYETVVTLIFQYYHTGLSHFDALLSFNIFILRHSAKMAFEKQAVRNEIDSNKVNQKEICIGR